MCEFTYMCVHEYLCVHVCVSVYSGLQPGVYVSMVLAKWSGHNLLINIQFLFGVAIVSLSKNFTYIAPVYPVVYL